MTGSWQVRRMRTEEWESLRRLRLEALQDTPKAFMDTYAQAVQRGDHEWQQWAEANATAPDRCMFIAEDSDGRWLGMMGAYTHEHRGPVLIAVYVRPDARGKGVSAALVGAVEEWARDLSHQELLLWVHEDNPPARRLYERLGYAYTGERDPYHNAEGEWELVMAKQL